MAIDNRRKRASIAALGLAFLGPSVVPDGTLAQADRQAIAHSYYGIEAGGAIVQIGATCQLENYAATGGITLERILGGTSQIEAYSATGGITINTGAGGTPRRKREDRDDVREASLAALLNRRAREQVQPLPAREQDVVYPKLKVSAEMAANRISVIKDDIDRQLAIEEFIDGVIAEDRERRRRRRDQIAVLLLLH